MVRMGEKNKTVIILTLICISAFLVRWYLMPSHLFFGPEQGRDFLAIRDIVANNKPTLIGAKTDVEGIFHGPLYYYLASVPFALSRGNPLLVAAFFIALQSLTVFLLYEVVRQLTGKRRAGIIAAALFALSYQLVVYARWLSNPPLSIPLSLLFFLFLIRFIKGKPLYLLALAYTYGLLGQAEFINFLLFGVIGLIMCWRNVLKTKPVMTAVAVLIGAITSAGTYIIFDVRHNFLILHAIGRLLTGKSGYQVDIVTSTLGAFRVLAEQTSALFGFWGWSIGALILVFVAIFAYRQYKLIIYWLFVPPVLFSLLRRGMLEQLYAGIIVGIIVAVSVVIEKVMRRNTALGYLAVITVLLTNLYALATNLPTNYHVFFEVQQPGVRYTDQRAAIDWMYKKAAGRPFSFQSYTIPYFVQDAWTYLLLYYGEPKYGYIPDNQGRKLLYAIIQRDRIDPRFQQKWYNTVTVPWGVRTDRTEIGEYDVEEWTL